MLCISWSNADPGPLSQVGLRCWLPNETCTNAGTLLGFTSHLPIEIPRFGFQCAEDRVLKDWVLTWTEHFATFCDVAKCCKMFVSVLSNDLSVGTQHSERYRLELLSAFLHGYEYHTGQFAEWLVHASLRPAIPQWSSRWLPKTGHHQQDLAVLGWVVGWLVWKGSCCISHMLVAAGADAASGRGSNPLRATRK